MTGNNSLKRLPSPNIKCKFIFLVNFFNFINSFSIAGSSGISGMNLGSSQKNVVTMNVNTMNLGANLGGSLNMAKYRSPSPGVNMNNMNSMNLNMNNMNLNTNSMNNLTNLNMNMNKSSTITIGSLKTNGVGKPKWK